MNNIKKMFSPIVLITIGFIGLIIGYVIPNAIIFLISYYITISSVFLNINFIKRKKYTKINLTENFWENEKLFAEKFVEENEQKVIDISKEYFEVFPHPRHQTVYHTSPNPKFER